MKNFHWIVRAAFLLLVPAAAAQTAVSIAPEQCVFRAGDDARWAASGLDESGWRPASQWTGDATIEPHFWLRCRVRPAELAPAVEPVMQVVADASYEVYVNAQFMARYGNLDTGAHKVGVINQYSSPVFASRQPFTLAIRITYSPTVYGQMPLPSIMLGDAGLVRDSYSARAFNALRSRWIVWLCNGVMAGAGLFFLTLYLFDRTQRLLLWASLAWLSLVLIRLSEFLVTASIHIPSWLEFLLYAVGNLQSAFYVAFFFALAGRRINLFFRVLLAINLADSGLLLVAALLPLRQSMAWRYWLDASPPVNSFLIPVDVLIALAPLVAFWPINKLPRSQFALYCVCSFWMGMDLLYMGAQIPWLHFSSYFFLSFQSARSIAIAAVVVAMTLLLIQRIRQTNRERAALATEMRAAREIQRVLVPARIESAPGLRAEAVFLPAQEVGGDFYRCRVLNDGSQWLLLGDVSGKGTAAGMTGAMLLGASEGHECNAPAEVLAHLNRVLCLSGVGGLATCVCARISPDGVLTLANAGHLPPYRNGEEINVEGGVPLGVDPAARYAEIHLTLEPSDTLTLLSDGVVEAQSATGELFGFDRTREIAMATAQEIAEKARQFGQRDDITVLKLAFSPAETLTHTK